MNQEPPFAIQLEPVEGCSLACSFCGLQAIRDNGADAWLEVHGKNSVPYRFATSALIERVALEIKRLGWNPRIEFAMHGEPTMHPDLPLLIRLVRKHLRRVYIMVTTNGSGITTAERIGALFDAGLNTLAFDMYKHAKWRSTTYQALLKYANDNAGMGFYRYPRDDAGNPHHRQMLKRITVINDISDNSSGTHQLTNQGGNSGSVEALQQRCAKPFRELSIRWNGMVALCCDDWKGEYKVGNAAAMPLDELWNHPRFEAARRVLYRGDRADIKVCSGCNVRTYRNGLLPDKMGKETMLDPDTNTYTTITSAQAGKVFSIKLKRGDV